VVNGREVFATAGDRFGGHLYAVRGCSDRRLAT